MSPHERKHFDRLLEQVIDRLPAMVKNLMDEVPLIVEDYPSAEMRRDLKLTEFEDLCGLFVGISKLEPELEHVRPHSDLIYLFREGILNEAMDEAGVATDAELMREIRITILHEYGHHFGLDEDELRELGYE